MAPVPVRDAAASIRTLNDNFRSTFVGGRVLMTQGVGALPIATKARVILAVQGFDEFSADNDPHREHDFGSFEVEGETYFWKIDLYEEPDVKDANGEPVVNRVLTIMLAEEY
ncbi:MAG: DUF3768 domain-containing protein [Xanthobacteraceae bacterium]